MAFPETTEAVAELFANRQYGQGAHTLSAARTGVDGIALGEVQFDPYLHDAYDIKPISLTELLTGQPQVDVVRPNFPVHINVVTDYTDKGDNDPIARSKRNVAHTVTKYLEEALSSVADRLDTYAVGSGMSHGSAILDAEELAQEDASEEEKAEAVASLCMRGLTVVISDFAGLPLYGTNGDFSETVGIKLNHLLERNVPANMGVIAISGGVEVNTNKPKKLAPVNNLLEHNHQEAISRLKDAGLSMASLVARADKIGGFDQTQSDKEISLAIKAL